VWGFHLSIPSSPLQGARAEVVQSGRGIDVASDPVAKTLEEDGAERDQPFFVAIGTQAIDRTHAAHTAAGDIGAAKGTNVFFMFGAKALRNEAVEWGAENLGSAAAKHGFGGGLNMVMRWESSTVINRIYGGADDGGKTGFLLLDGVLDVPGLGDVASDFGGADDGTGGVAERRNGGGDENGLAVFASADGFEMLDAQAFADAGENVDFFGGTICAEHWHSNW
jgi:hypothetical protein